MLNGIYFIICLMCVFCNTCFADLVIRDSEVENVLSTFVEPLFKYAGLGSKKINIWIVDDGESNAYIYNNDNIFITKGLLEFSDEPYVVVSVIAHEIGHIASHHINNRSLKFNNIMRYIGLSYILGLITAFTVSPDLGTAIFLGGNSIGTSLMMSYSRLQEVVADQYALNLLDKVKYKNFGLRKLLKYFSTIEVTNNYFKYFRTHPFAKERLFDIDSYVSKNRAKNFSNDLINSFKRVRLKILGYFNSDFIIECKVNSIQCRYMNVILNYRNSNINKAMILINKLIVDYPKDPYFHEIKGQMLYKLDKMQLSVEEYKNALRLLKGDPFLIKFELSRSMIYINPDKAIKIINTLLEDDFKNITLWHELSLAYFKSNNKAMLHYALAFEYFYVEDIEKATKEARLFLRNISQKSKYINNIKNLLYSQNISIK